MGKFTLDIMFKHDRPFIPYKLPSHIDALFDTGAAVPVINMTQASANLIGKRVEGIVLPLTGFGGDGSEAYKYVIKSWRLGHITFHNMSCLVPSKPHPHMPKIILPASMLKGTQYAIDTINDKLVVKYPDNYDLNRRLLVTQSNGKIAILSQGLQYYKTITGSTYYEVHIHGDVVVQGSVKDLTTEETLQVFEDIRSKYNLDSNDYIQILHSDHEELQDVGYF